jgi:DNA-binding NarL/FixJ family response regulator
MPRNNRNWTHEDEEKLLQLIAEGKSFAVISKELGRTEAAASSRASTVRSRAQLKMLRKSKVGDEASTTTDEGEEG